MSPTSTPGSSDLDELYAINMIPIDTDLTQRPPRSMRSRLGGFVILARILDKGRATLAKKNGEYNYNSPTDQHLVRFLGLDLEALLRGIS